VQGQPPDTLVLDLTPGTKWMTLIADRAMPAGSWRLYVKNDTLSSPDNAPGREANNWSAGRASSEGGKNSFPIQFFCHLPEARDVAVGGVEYTASQRIKIFSFKTQGATTVEERLKRSL
jgi:hypothetical protein